MDVKEVDMVIFSIGDFVFGTEVDQIVSIVRPSGKTEQIDKGIPLVDLYAKLSGGVTYNQPVILLVNTDEGVMGAYVQSVRGIMSVPLEQIEPLPDFLKGRIQTNCIWGVGKLSQQLIFLLDLNEYLVLNKA